MDGCQSISNGIVKLPAEIQARILQYILLYSTRNQLKQFRFSRSTRSIVTPLLFGTLHISASKKSFERLEKIAGSKILARCVRMLVFHRGTWAGHSVTRSMLRPKDFDDFCGAVNKRRRIINGHADQLVELSEMCAKPDLEQLYTNFQDEIRHEIAWEREIDMVRFISRLVPLMPHLSGVSVPAITSQARLNGNGLTNDEDDEQLSEYFERKTGLQQQTWTHNYFAPVEVMQAIVLPLSGLPYALKAIHKSNVALDNGQNRMRGLRELRLEGVNLVDFAELFLNQSLYRPNELDEALKSCFGQLRVFSFSPTYVIDNEWTNRYTEFVRGWCMFIGTFCGTLEELQLDMNLRDAANLSVANPNGITAPDVLSIGHAIVNGILRNSCGRFNELRTLKFVEVEMYKDDFIAFLEDVSSTLEVLEVHGWEAPGFGQLKDVERNLRELSVITLSQSINHLRNGLRKGRPSILRHVVIHEEL